MRRPDGADHEEADRAKVRRSDASLSDDDMDEDEEVTMGDLELQATAVSAACDRIGRSLTLAMDLPSTYRAEAACGCRRQCALGHTFCARVYG